MNIEIDRYDMEIIIAKSVVSTNILWLQLIIYDM